MAGAYRARPSDLLAVPDSWQAFELDEAVMIFAGEVQARMDRAEAQAIGRNRPAGPAVQRALEEALGIRKIIRPPSASGRRYDVDLGGATGVPTIRPVTAA